MTNTTTNTPNFAFLHPEGTDGFLHVSVLGAGIQGTATLVRSASPADSQLIVRKRSAPVSPSESPFADQFSLPHPHIVQLLGAHNYHNPATGKCSSATYWPYANDNSLTSLCKKFRRAGSPVPEVLVWQALTHVLKAHEAMHAAGRSHRDGHAGNVFVHWDGSSHLPDFILGDLGMCEVLPVGECLSGEDLEEEIDLATAAPGFVKGVAATNARMDLLLGQPTLQQVFEYDEDETCAKIAGTEMELYHFPKALMYIGKDIADASACLSTMMDGLDFDETQVYSPDLIQFAQLLYNVEHFARSIYVRTLERWQLIYAQVRLAAERGLAGAIGRTMLPVPGRELLGPSAEEGRPVLFESVRELLACEVRPPGPWYVAAVDPVSLSVIEVDRSKVYCAEDWFCTDALGRKVDVNPGDLSSL